MQLSGHLRGVKHSNIPRYVSIMTVLLICDTSPSTSTITRDIIECALIIISFGLRRQKSFEVEVRYELCYWSEHTMECQSSKLLINNVPLWQNCSHSLKSLSLDTYVICMNTKSSFDTCIRNRYQLFFGPLIQIQNGFHKCSIKSYQSEII